MFEKLKWDVVRKHVVVPSLTRVGTLITGWIAGQGIPGDHAQAVGLGVAAAGLIAFDLTVSWMARRALERKVADRAVSRFLSDPRARL